MKSKKFLMAIVCTVLVLALGACNNPYPAEESATALVETKTGSISMAGSTTIQPLAELMAEAFMDANPEIRIDVQGGGSSVGVKATGQSTTDIGMASREINGEELTEFPNINVTVIARDGIAAVVSSETPVDGLTLDQVRGIFSGEITNWSVVGGPDEVIFVVSREEGSGTRDAFQNLVMGKELLITENAILQASNGSVRTTVSTTPNSIGYLSFGYLNESVKVLSIDGIAATEENVANGLYSVVRPLNLLTNGEPQGAVKAFLEFILSQEGQAIVVAEGYLSVE